MHVISKINVAKLRCCLSLDVKIGLLVEVCGIGAVAFDTHKVVKDLKRAGFNDQQDEAVVSAVGEAVGENVATKADLEPVATKADLQASLEPYATKAELYRAFWIQTWIVFVWVITVLWLLHQLNAKPPLPASSVGVFLYARFV